MLSGMVGKIVTVAALWNLLNAGLICNSPLSLKSSPNYRLVCSFLCVSPEQFGLNVFEVVCGLGGLELNNFV